MNESQHIDLGLCPGASEISILQECVGLVPVSLQIQFAIHERREAWLTGLRDRPEQIDQPNWVVRI